MSPSRRSTATATVLLAVFLSSSMLVLRQVDRMRRSTPLQEVLFLTSPKLLKRLSLGYDGLLACVYWTRVVQYFGSKHFAGAREYALLAPLLEITTALDPHLIVAYEFGANFLAPPPPGGAGEPEQAIALTEFGIRNNPEEWRLYYDLGFVYYMDLHDYKNAAHAFARGAQVPNAHPWLKLMAALMAEHAGEIQTSRMLWTTTYQTTSDRNIRANAAAHLRALQVDEDVTNLEALVSSYRQRTEHWPAAFSDLEAAGMLRGLPSDPLGQPYKLCGEGRVEVTDPDDLPFIQKGTPAGYVPPLKPRFLPTD